jgi:hypothetical protein
MGAYKICDPNRESPIRRAEWTPSLYPFRPLAGGTFHLVPLPRPTSSATAAIATARFSKIPPSPPTPRSGPVFPIVRRFLAGTGDPSAAAAVGAPYRVRPNLVRRCEFFNSPISRCVVMAILFVVASRIFSTCKFGK